MMAEGDMATIFVCGTCRAADEPVDALGTRAGTRMACAIERELARRGGASAVRMIRVECLAVCKRPATVAVAGRGRWTYVYGDLQPDRDAGDLIAGVLAYADAPAGLVPWRLRPSILRKGVIARVPPLGFSTPENKS